MFWPHPDFQEEEWSLSAKLFGGLVLNPFSSPNRNDDSLFTWFLRRVTGDDAVKADSWAAQPEYNPKSIASAGRNDWRICVGDWTIAIECKFGDGLDLNKDCRQYLEGLPPPPYRRLVLVATVSEFSELTHKCAHGGFSSQDVEFLRETIAAREVVCLPWHEVVEAATARLPEEAGQTLNQWAQQAIRRDGVEVMPARRISGEEVASCILSQEAAAIPISHFSDARSRRESTSSVKGVCDRTNAPSWVGSYLKELRRDCDREGLIFEEKDRGWVNIRSAGPNSVTLVPWSGGIAMVISHPRRGREYPGMRPLVNLSVFRGHPNLATSPSQWFPRDRAVGREFEDQEAAEIHGSIGDILDLLSLLMGDN